MDPFRNFRLDSPSKPGITRREAIGILLSLPSAPVLNSPITQALIGLDQARTLSEILEALEPLLNSFEVKLYNETTVIKYTGSTSEDGLFPTINDVLKISRDGEYYFISIVDAQNPSKEIILKVSPTEISFKLFQTDSADVDNTKQTDLLTEVLPADSIANITDISAHHIERISNLANASKDSPAVLYNIIDTNFDLWINNGRGFAPTPEPTAEIHTSAHEEVRQQLLNSGYDISQIIETTDHDVIYGVERDDYTVVFQESTLQDGTKVTYANLIWREELRFKNILFIVSSNNGQNSINAVEVQMRPRGDIPNITAPGHYQVTSFSNLTPQDIEALPSSFQGTPLADYLLSNRSDLTDELDMLIEKTYPIGILPHRSDVARLQDVSILTKYRVDNALVLNEATNTAQPRGAFQTGDARLPIGLPVIEEQ